MDEKKRISQRVLELTGWASHERYRILTDTTNWMDILRGDILRLGGREYLIKGNQHETRFGIADQPKMWVFNALELESGTQKIIKMVFVEEFNVHVGLFKIHCYRSAEKEGYVLEIGRGDDRFMQGEMMIDDHDNHVRVLDFIKGTTHFNLIYGIDKPHEQYFREDLPRLLRKLLVSFEAIGFLHKHGTCHGDIRNDHIIIESETGKYRWIDFDLNQHVSDYDVWSMGNIINYAVGKGITSFQQVLRNREIPADIKNSLCEADASAFFEYRIMNLRKLYPYIPDKLSDILSHFMVRPRAFYANVDEFLEDYRRMLSDEFPETE